MSDTALIPVEQKKVVFYDDEITAVLVQIGDEEKVYVPIKPVCDFLGVSWSGQRRRINRDAVLSEETRSVNVTFTEPTRTRQISMICLPLDYISGFLFGINAARTKPEIKDKLIRYQRECYRILADAFVAPVLSVQPIDSDEQSLMQLHNMALVIASTTKEMLEVRQLSVSNETRLNAASEYIRGMNNRLKVVEQRTRSGSLTEAQAREVQHRVNLIAQELTVHDPSVKHHGGVYETLRQETMSTSYKRIPMKGYEDALSFLDDWLKAMQQADVQAKSDDGLSG